MNTTDSSTAFWTTGETGRFLGCTSRRVLALVRAGDLTGIRTAAGTLIRPADAHRIAATLTAVPRDSRGRILLHKRGPKRSAAC
jgi:hypothetical protein